MNLSSGVDTKVYVQRHMDGEMDGQKNGLLYHSMLTSSTKMDLYALKWLCILSLSLWTALRFYIKCSCFSSEIVSEGLVNVVVKVS